MNTLAVFTFVCMSNVERLAIAPFDAKGFAFHACCCLTVNYSNSLRSQTSVMNNIPMNLYMPLRINHKTTLYRRNKVSDIVFPNTQIAQCKS